MQYTPKAYLTYALNKDGHLVHIDSVPNGNNCECFCPHCKEELCARNNGEIRIHHFSHKSGADCAGAIESALHIMAKEILQEIKCVQLPNAITSRLILKNEDSKKNKEYEFNKQDKLKFNKVDVECADLETNLRPDCIGYYDDKKLWIEFKKTHAVDEEKKAKIVDASIDCIEIDLNNCELDYDAVRKFIKEDNAHRIWINKIGSEERIIRYNSRSFVKDENGNIVNILKDNLDENKHSYYCLACGKRLFLGKMALNLLGRYFLHNEDNSSCSYEQYLHNAASEIIFDKFNKSKNFEIRLPQKRYCENHNYCKFYNENKCFLTSEIKYDLKEHGYIECKKYSAISFQDNIYDLIIKRKEKSKDDIIISFSENVINDDHKIIKIKVKDEKSLELLYSEPIRVLSPEFINFKRESSQTLPSYLINRPVIKKISLFSGGKYNHLPKLFSCKTLGTQPLSKIFEKRTSTIYEVIFIDEIENATAREYFLYKCYNNKKKACYCELCIFRDFINKYYGDVTSKLICKLYKTKGTPEFPLKEQPINCQCFELDRNLASYLDKLQVEIIEN